VTPHEKVIVVVGGAGGIGLATAEMLLQKDYSLVVADKNSARVDSFKSRYRELLDKRVFPWTFDIADRRACGEILQWIKGRLKFIDGLIITAAVHNAHPVEYLADELVDRVLNVNLIAHIKFVRDCLPLIKDGGRIVAVSSIAAGIGIPMESLYSASKAGLEMFYESLSVEISYRQIKCSVIHPGNINTGFNETGNDYQPQGRPFVDEGYRKVIASIDSRRGMSPPTVARTIVLAIASPNPRFCYVVGQNALKAHWAKRLLGRDLALKVMAKYFGF